jgi:hypothetical protein
MRLVPRGIAVLALALSVVGALWTDPALAKGPTRAVIRGPGLETPIVVGYRSARTSDVFATLVARSGIFQGLWCVDCGGAAAGRPPGPLGPRFTVTYTLELDRVRHDRVDHVVQLLFPYAQPRPVTFVHRGQPFDLGTTGGGWYIARPSLRGLLRGLGVPPRSHAAPIASAAAPATAAATSGPSHRAATPLWIVLAVAVASLAIASLRRTRGRTNPGIGPAAH